MKKMNGGAGHVLGSGEEGPFLNVKEMQFIGHFQKSREKVISNCSSYESVLANEFFIRWAEKSRNVFWIRSPDYKKQLYVSPAYETIWGRSCQSLYEHPEAWPDYLNPEDRSRLEKQFSERNASVAPNTRYDEWYRIIRPDGEVRWVKDASFPIYDNLGHCIGFAGVAEDITEEKKYQVEAVNRAKTEFLSNISHDVKTPLSGIISFAEILSFRVQEEYRPIIHDILEASKNLMAFFENCIGLVRSETGSIVLVKEAFNLKHLLNEIAVLLQPTIKAKNLAFHIDYDEKIPPQLLGSRVTLYRILLNLLGNAIKFTSEGSVSFQAELEQKSTADPITIKFTIADTGIGIPADQQALIFERFTRLTPSYEGVYEGSGIGLYIVKEFVKAMHGEIDLKSEKGKGSQFTVTVPFEVSLAADDAHDSEDNTLSILTPSASSALTTASTSANILPIPLESSANQTLSPKILLVEDSLLAKNSIVMVLNSLGYEVDIAECGAEAVALFVPGKYALVFMDIGLPDIKGYQVTERLRAMEQGTVFYTPILGLSAHVTQEERQLSMAAGMDEMHTKPLLLETAKLLVKKYNMPEKTTD